MKLFTPFALAALLAISANSTRASFHDSPVRLEVRIVGSDSHDRIRGSTAVEHNQKKQLAISVSTVAREALPGLTVKWFVFGRDAATDRVSVLRSGQSKLNLTALGSQVVKSDEIKADYTPEHSVVSRIRGRGTGSRSAGRVSVKKVAGEGDKFIGYGVQVLQGSRVVAETFDPSSMKENVTSKSN